MRIKNKLRFFIIVIFILTNLGVFIGCNRGSTGTEERMQYYAWPLGTSSPEDTVTQIMAQKFADEVDRLSEGKMKIEVYPNSVVGGDRELLESCKDGDIPFVVQNTAPQVAFMKELAVFDLPSAFSSIEEVRKSVDNKNFLNKIKVVYKNAGYKLLGYGDQGFRVMSTNKKVSELNDFKGQKIRTMENSYHIQFWKSLNASPTPMSFSEVYIGLQQKTIDAQENPYEVIVSSKLYEQQKYIIETNHLPHLISLIVNDEFYSNLSEKQQKIIDEASEIAIKYAREESDKRIEEKIKQIEDSGTEIVKLSEDLRKDIIKSSEPVYESIRKSVGNDLVDSYSNGE